MSILELWRGDAFRGRVGRWIWRIVLNWFLVWSAVGVFVLALNLAPPGGAAADVIFMSLASILIAMETARQRGVRWTLWAFGWIALGSGLIESMGTLTGWPFGRYVYTDAFGWKLGGILPVSIPLAWWVILLPLYRLACSQRHAPEGAASFLLIPLVVSAGAVWIDLVLEPVAWINRSYWIWEDGGRYYGVPAMNFAGWFGTSWLLTAGLLVFDRSRRAEKTGASPAMVSAMVLLVVVVTFTAAAWMGAFPLAAAIGTAFLGYLTASIVTMHRRTRVARSAAG